MADVYLQRLDQIAPKARRITDKMWQNFEYLGLVSLMFPAARQLLADGRAAVSLIR